MFARWGICGLLLGVGFVIGLGYASCSSIAIEPTVTIGQLLQCLVTLGLALVVSKWWRDAHFRTDTAKDLLLAGLDRVRTNAAEVEVDFKKLCSGPWVQSVFQDVITKNRLLSNSISEIDATARAVFRATPCRELRSAAFDLKRATTSVGPKTLKQYSSIDYACARFSLAVSVTQVAILHL